MIHTYGKMPTSLPDGMFKAVRFPTMTVMEQTTGDHRRLAAAGGGARPTPTGTWSLSAQFKIDMGHYGGDLTGVINEITFDDETGNVSGRGFVIDDEYGRRHAFAIKSGAMAGVSVGLAEVAVRFVEDLDTGDYFFEFTKWNIADMTGVMTPAFVEAYATIDEEITAAFEGEDPMEELVASCQPLPFHVVEPTDEVAELLASFDGIVQRYSDFFRPEADEPTKIVVTADGKVYGHLCTWDSFHDSMAGKVRPPRPTDGYASFNKPGVLTEKGIVPTGPIFAYGGHRPGKGVADLADVYGGIENAWCDVRTIEGRFGPWVSGVVRPGVPEETVYAARASRVSGHWISGALRGIVSVNVEGYDVKGPDADVLDLAAAYAWRTGANGEVLELVASFDGPAPAQVEAARAVASVEYTDPALIAGALARYLDRTGAAGAAVDAIVAEAAAELTGDPFAFDDDLLLALELEG